MEDGEGDEEDWENEFVGRFEFPLLLAGGKEAWRSAAWLAAPTER